LIPYRQEDQNGRHKRGKRPGVSTQMTGSANDHHWTSPETRVLDVPSGEPHPNLTGVLEATVRDPSRSRPRRQTNARAQIPSEQRRRRATHPYFHACVAPPEGTLGLTRISAQPIRRKGDGPWHTSYPACRHSHPEQRQGAGLVFGDQVDHRPARIAVPCAGLGLGQAFDVEQAQRLVAAVVHLLRRGEPVSPAACLWRSGCHSVVYHVWCRSSSRRVGAGARSDRPAFIGVNEFASRSSAERGGPRDELHGCDSTAGARKSTPVT
jgi:hypothetical protein